MYLVLPKILDAIELASVAHQGQVRGSRGVPYLNHVLDVARRVSQVGFNDRDTIIAALLHDTVEDTAVTHQEISAKFGYTVSELVAHLTLPTEAQNDREKKQEFQIRKMREMNINGQAIKIADKTSNVSDLYTDPPKWSPRAIQGYADAAREVVLSVTFGGAAPILRLGLDPRLSRLVVEFESTYRATATHYGWVA